MARTRHINPALFSASELIEACDISARNFQWLREGGLGPFGGRFDLTEFPSGLYPEATLAELAVIAGLVETGFELGLSAMFFRAFLDVNPSHIASRFAMFDSFPRGERAPWQESQFRHLQGVRDDNMSGYDPAAVSAADIVLIIAGRKWVLEGTLGQRKLAVALPFGGSTTGPLPLGELHGMSKGGRPQFVAFWEGLDHSDKTAQMVAHEQFLQEALQSVGQVRVNASLAIRRAFNRVYDLRLAKGGPFWPQEGV